MTHLGGGAEASRPRDTHDPSGEPESLWGQLITDQDGGDAAGAAPSNANEEALDDDISVAVEFEEYQEDDESVWQGFLEESDDDEEDIQELNGAGCLRMGGLDDEEMEEAKEGPTLNVGDIDAYWLQRKVSKAYDEIDHQHCQKLAEDVLQILAEGDGGDVERKLVTLLGYGKFDLIKLLLRNRLKITWCTRLAQAEDQEHRKKIEEDMRDKGPILSAILEQLYCSRASAEEREKNLVKSIREEAKRLKDEHASGDGDRENQKVADRESGSGWLKSPWQILDLESIDFHQGGHLMANRTCKLPRGSCRNLRKGYTEVHVPAPEPKALAPGEELVKVSMMPEWAQPAFEGMKQLNRVQSRVYETAFSTPENMLLCAPTGAGKTNVAILTILHEIGLHRKDGELDNTKYKIVYVAPMKALVAKILRNLSRRLQSFNVTVMVLSGDQNLTRQQIEETQVIVTTPENWDIITRRYGERTYTQLVKLIIIDEIHLLHDDRGPVLESIVARTVRHIETTKEHIRLVGLSATLLNYEDVALFLRVNPLKGLFRFDNSYRHCPLAQHYVGVTVKKPLQRFRLMNDICYEKVLAAAGKHQVLIFVHSRKETAKTACAIRDTALTNDTLSRFLKEDGSASREILQSQAEHAKSNDLKDLLPYGFAIHHAGMARVDRMLVEGLFADGHVQVLVSTATLDWRVNLTAHTVIIKGTQVYNPEKGAWAELGPLDVMQMLGRAGRPQYDSNGEGIILTGHNELMYYLSLMNQQLPIESQLAFRLADQLNAEIVLGTVQNAQEACTWIGYTYLYIRMLRNPTLYGMPPDILNRDKTLEERRADLIRSATSILVKDNLIKYDRKSGYFQATDLGRIASYYSITHGTISTYNEYLKPTTGDIELFRLFSLSEEFKYVSVQQDEKIELAKLLDRVPIPVKESLEEPSAKINVLLQAYVSQHKLEGLSLIADMVFIGQSAAHLLRALFEIVLKRGWAPLTEKALNLCKMVEKRMWNIQTPLRQFSGIPNEILMKLEKKDLAWDRYLDLSMREIGEFIGCPEMGEMLHMCIHQLPKVNLAARVHPITRTMLGIQLTITPDFQWDDKVHGYVQPFWVIVEDNDREHVLYHEYFMLEKRCIEDHTLNFTVPICKPLPPQYFIRVVSDRWLGSLAELPVCFRHLILPKRHQPARELLYLQPLPVTALRNSSFEALYYAIKHFSTIQTWVFTVLYETDDNVLVAAPTGTGKTICAEFALLRNLQKGLESPMRAVYVAPVETLAEERYDEWRLKFGCSPLKLKVMNLTGDTATDLESLRTGNIIISTPEKWDALSRRWRQRELVQQVSLFIVDGLHLIGGKAGSILEIIVSRMRCIASHIGSEIRIVALSASVANAKDVGEWIGATSDGLFNFPPSVRPVPLEIHVQGVDIADFEARMQAMTRQTYAAVVQHAQDGKPALVFVATRKQARVTAMDLCTYSAANGDKAPFLLRPEIDVEVYLPHIEDDILKMTLTRGVGYLHEGLTTSEKDLVLNLFVTGGIQLCVSSISMCWGKQIPAHLVVVMGTKYHDGRGNAHADYPITDLIQMSGHAGRPLVDDCGKCVILCHAPRKEYYQSSLNEALHLESHLQQFLHDHLNAEVSGGLIENMQDAIDYLTWSFMYQRLTKNPNYYGLQRVSHAHLSVHLSSLVESALSDLESRKCVAVEDDFHVKPLILGVISTYHYISYSTVERFSASLTPKTTMKGLLDILASASEYSVLPIRAGEEEQIRRLINHQRFRFGNPKCTDPHTKANALLQAHFSRHTLVGDLAADQREVLHSALRLIHAMVDVISSNGWLDLAIFAMELSQMVTQGLWTTDSPLLQVPRFTKELVRRFEENPRRSVRTMFDLLEMEKEERGELLPVETVSDFVWFCEHFPLINVSCSVIEGGNIRPGDKVRLLVTLERKVRLWEERRELTQVFAPRYPNYKREGWWLVVCEPAANHLLAIARVYNVNISVSVNLEFNAPTEVGEKTYFVYLISDSYIGCNHREASFRIDVKESGEGDGAY